MAKELHIKLDDIIGYYEDEFGFVWPGFLAINLEGVLETNPDAEMLTIHGDCPGGDIIEGYRIINRLEAFKRDGGKVRVINEGECASMMTAIMQAASPGMREALPASTWMMHKPLYDQLRFVNANDLRRLAFQLDNFEETLLNIYVNASGNPLETVKAHFEEEIFISSEEAVRRGYIDRIIEANTKIQPKQREAKAVAFYTPTQPINQTTEMAEEQKPTGVLAKMKAAAAAFMSALNEAEEETPTPQAATETLADGGTIHFDGELAEGTAVFTDAELTTAVADGDHELSDGRTITVAEGVVTVIAEATDEAAAAIAEKDAQIQSLTEKLEAAQAVAAKVPTLESRIQALEKKVPGGGQKPNTPPQNFNQNTPPPANSFDGAAQRLKNKYNK